MIRWVIYSLTLTELERAKQEQSHHFWHHWFHPLPRRRQDDNCPTNTPGQAPRRFFNGWLKTSTNLMCFCREKCHSMLQPYYFCDICLVYFSSLWFPPLELTIKWANFQPFLDSRLKLHIHYCLKIGLVRYHWCWQSQIYYTFNNQTQSRKPNNFTMLAKLYSSYIWICLYIYIHIYHAEIDRNRLLSKDTKDFSFEIKLFFSPTIRSDQNSPHQLIGLTLESFCSNKISVATVDDISANTVHSC